MIAFNAHYDAKVFVPYEPLKLVPNQKVRLQIEPIDSLVLLDTLPSQANRIEFGLQKGLVVYLAPDLQDPLPDDIWLHNNESDSSDRAK